MPKECFDSPSPPGSEWPDHVAPEHRLEAGADENIDQENSGEDSARKAVDPATLTRAARRRIEADESPAWVETPITERFDWAAIFGNANPVEIDLGAGDGGFVAGRAAAYPERNFLAVERLLGRARKIAIKQSRQRLDNLRVCRVESAYLVRWMCAPGSVAVIHLMFPDPWPKARHHKRRLVQADFVASVADALALGGEFRFTTDHNEYFEEACPRVDDEARLDRDELWDYGRDPRTEFQQQWDEEGRATYRARWRRVEVS